MLWVLQSPLHAIVLDSRCRQHTLPLSIELATVGSGRNLKNIVYRDVSTCKREIVKKDKADPSIMEYVVIVLRTRSGIRKEVPREVVAHGLTTGTVMAPMIYIIRGMRRGHRGLMMTLIRVAEGIVMGVGLHVGGNVSSCQIHNVVRGFILLVRF